MSPPAPGSSRPGLMQPVLALEEPDVTTRTITQQQRAGGAAPGLGSRLSSRLASARLGGEGPGDFVGRDDAARLHLAYGGERGGAGAFGGSRPDRRQGGRPNCLVQRVGAPLHHRIAKGANCLVQPSEPEPQRGHPWSAGRSSRAHAGQSTAMTRDRMPPVEADGLVVRWHCLEANRPMQKSPRCWPLERRTKSMGACRPIIYAVNN